MDSLPNNNPQALSTKGLRKQIRRAKRTQYCSGPATFTPYTIGLMAASVVCIAVLSVIANLDVSTIVGLIVLAVVFIIITHVFTRAFYHISAIESQRELGERTSEDKVRNLIASLVAGKGSIDVSEWGNIDSGCLSLFVLSYISARGFQKVTKKEMVTLLPALVKIQDLNDVAHGYLEVAALMNGTLQEAIKEVLMCINNLSSVDDGIVLGNSLCEGYISALPVLPGLTKRPTKEDIRDIFSNIENVAITLLNAKRVVSTDRTQP